MQNREREKLDLYFTTHKINSKWIKDLYVRLKTIKLLGENIDDNLLDIGVDNDFLDLTLKAKINGTTSN